MLHDIDLRDLSEREGAERAFVSAYFGGPDAHGSLQRREAAIRELLADEAEEATHFEESMAMIRAWLDEHHAEGERCCVFASWAADWVEGHRIGVELPDVLRVGPAPYIRPLAELQEEYSRFLTVVCDNEATSIHAVAASQAEVCGTVRGDVKNRVKKGGWSQRRYARRRENQLHRYAQEVAARLEALVREEGYERIVLLGSEEPLLELRGVLPEIVRERIVGQKGVDTHDGPDELVETAFELFFAEERESEKSHWEEIRAEALGGSLGALGADDVLRAAQVGRVDSAVVWREAKIVATRCRSCENVYAGEHQSCEACSGTDVFPVDYVDALARQLELTDAEIDFVDAMPGLRRVGGVGALLRY